MSNFSSMSDLAQRIAILVGFNQYGSGFHNTEVPASVSREVERNFHQISREINQVGLGFKVVGYDYLNQSLMTQH